MKRQFLFLICIIFIVTMACQEKDAPLLQGNIRGVASLVDCYGNLLTDASGIKVQLTGENKELETTTDSYGKYIFQDLPFGTYHLKFIKENFIQYKNRPVYHIGGDASTPIDMEMNEVPDYSYGIDSMIYYHYDFLIYTHFIGATKAFNKYRNFYVHCFFSQSPDVSCENFEYSFIWMADPDIYFTFWNANNRFLNNYTGTVYCRIYAQSDYDKVWEGYDADPHPVYPETLGPPSEVFSFTVAGITRTNSPY